mmetsp:Transcript_26518/g.50914  ORF Transcript_26518/g.50914 Transcript_26518/m.50914 type:complete len:940 (-) Transcript_26518:41-2860(-)
MVWVAAIVMLHMVACCLGEREEFAFRTVTIHRRSNALDLETLAIDIRKSLNETVHAAQDGSWLMEEGRRALASFEQGKVLHNISIKLGGLSPAVFLTSHDRKYIVKSIDDNEAKVLDMLWPKLKDHMQTHGSESLLPRYPTGVIQGSSPGPIKAWSIFRNVNAYEVTTGRPAPKEKVSVLDTKGRSQLGQGYIGGKVGRPGFYDVQDNLELTQALANNGDVMTVVNRDMEFLESVSSEMTFVDFSLLTIKQPKDELSSGTPGLAFDNTGLLFVSPVSDFAYSAAFIDLLSLMDNKQTENTGARHPAQDIFWQRNRKALEFHHPLGRYTFYPEAMRDMFAMLADPQFAEAVQDEKDPEFTERGSVSKGREDLIAMRLLGTAVARHGNTLGDPPTVSEDPQIQFARGLYNMCLDDCDCKIADKAFKPVPTALREWLNHLRQFEFCKKNKDLARLTKMKSIGPMTDISGNDLKHEANDMEQTLADMKFVRKCEPLTTFQHQKQFFNGYCPFPANLVNKFPSFDTGNCDGQVVFENETSVATLRNIYNDKIQSNPVFIDDLIRLRKNTLGHFESRGQQLELSAYAQFPRLYNMWKWPEDADGDYSVGVLFAPNLGYNMLHHLGIDATAPDKMLKNMVGGITYLAWFLHPLTLSAQNMKDGGGEDYELNNWEDPAKVKMYIRRIETEKLMMGASLENVNVNFQRTKASSGKIMTRPKEQMTGTEMRQKSGKKYYSTIMDFENSDLQLLKHVRTKVIQAFESLHGLALPEDCPSGRTTQTGQDAILLYFHFPYALNTNTVHLHARMNQGIHPFEAQYSVFLDDIINHLEHHENIYGLIMNRMRQGQDATSRSPFAQGFGCIGKHLAELFENEPFKWNEKGLGVTFVNRWKAADPSKPGWNVTEVVPHYCPPGDCGKKCLQCDALTNKHPEWGTDDEHEFFRDLMM